MPWGLIHTRGEIAAAFLRGDAGSLTATVARRGSSAKMGDDHLACRHQFPPAIIQHAVWLYVRFTLSYRDVKICSLNLGLKCPTKRRNGGC